MTLSQPVRNCFLQGQKIFFLLLFLSGCMPAKIRKTSTGQPLQKYYSFSKSPVSINNGSLDTTNIYINGQEWVKTYQSGKAKDVLFPQNSRIEKVFEYQYVKFGSNGIAFLSNHTKDSYSGLNIYEMDGQYCYYAVDGDELQLELFDFHSKKFIIWYARIFSDKLLFYKDRIRLWYGGKGKLNLVYEKSLIKYKKPLIWPE